MREFSLLGFIEHVAVMSAEVAVASHEGIERGLEIIEQEAKASVGTYQAQSGPFAAWEELAEATKADRVAQGYPENEPELRTGEMAASIEHTVINSFEGEVGSDDQVLEWQELGTENMPPRSILGGAAARKADEVVGELGDKIHASLVGDQVYQKRLPIS